MQVVVPVVFLLDIEQDGEVSIERMEEIAQQAVGRAADQAAGKLAGYCDQRDRCRVAGVAVSAAPAAYFSQWHRPRKKRA